MSHSTRPLLQQGHFGSQGQSCPPKATCEIAAQIWGVHLGLIPAYGPENDSELLPAFRALNSLGFGQDGGPKK